MIYAFNWYNIGGVAALIGVSLRATTAEIGIAYGAFLVGVGLFQIPAGLAAVRFGTRRVSLLGLGAMGVSAVASAFSPNWQVLALTRFLVGSSAAFFFSPALSLVASYFPPGSRGPVIGLYNGGFSIGSAVGLFTSALVGARFGWWAPLLVGGVGLLLTALACGGALPPATIDRENRSMQDAFAAAGRVLRSRSIWALSLALSGFWAAVFAVAQYFVLYGAAVHPEWGSALAAGLASIVVVLAFPGGPLGGWLGDRGWDRRWVIGSFAAVASVCVLAVPFLPITGLWALFVLLGLADGVCFAILYLIPSYLPESEGEGLALGVATVNSIQVFLGSGLAVAFAFVAVGFGYTAAWLYVGVVSLALLPLLRWVVPNAAASLRRPASAAAVRAEPGAGARLR